MQKIGEILINNNIITREQLDKALDYQVNVDQDSFIGEILIFLGFIDINTFLQYLGTQLQDKVASQKNNKSSPSNKKLIGQMLIEAGEITQEELNQALAIKSGSSDKYIGEVLVELGFIDLDVFTDYLICQLKARRITE